MRSWQKRSMTAQEYGAIIGHLGLNKAQAGRFLGVSLRTAHRYFDGDAVVPEAHALLLRAMLHYEARPQVPAWKRGS